MDYYDDYDDDAGRFSLDHSEPLPLYYAGLELGSANTSLIVSSQNNGAYTVKRATLPSFLADGNPAHLFPEKDPAVELGHLLGPGEYVLTWHNRCYFLGDLLEQGSYPDNALGDQRRYWSEHAQMLLLCLACTLIAEPRFALRLVTALPVSLYTSERRGEVQRELSRRYHFTFNGETRDVDVYCGYVAMQGQGILMQCGNQSSSQAVIDIGEHTTTLIAAKGQRLIGRLCRGHSLGVGQLVEDLQQFAHDCHCTLSVEQAHAILKAYTLHKPYSMIRTGFGYPEDEDITLTIEDSLQRLARPLASFLARTWNIEGCAPGSQFETIYLAGGGAHYFGDIVCRGFPDKRIITVSDSHFVTLSGYLALATSLPEARWEEAVQRLEDFIAHVRHLHDQ